MAAIKKNMVGAYFAPRTNILAIPVSTRGLAYFDKVLPLNTEPLGNRDVKI
jgi:hypothetical protein